MKNIIICFFFPIVLLSCTGVEPEDNLYKFTIENNSGVNIKLTLFYMSTDGIEQDSIYSLSTEAIIEHEYINYLPTDPFSLNADSAVIVFNDYSRIIYRRNDETQRNILDLNNYNLERKGKYFNHYKYFLTDLDYNNAIPLDD